MNLFTKQLESVMVSYRKITDIDKEKLVRDLRLFGYPEALCNKLCKPINLSDMVMMISSSLAKRIECSNRTWSLKEIYRAMETMLKETECIVICTTGEDDLIRIKYFNDVSGIDNASGIIDPNLLLLKMGLSVESTLYGYYSLNFDMMQLPSTKPFVRTSEQNKKIWIDIVHEVVSLLSSSGVLDIWGDTKIELSNGYISCIRDDTSASMVSVMIGGYLYGQFPDVVVPEISGANEIKALSNYFHLKQIEFPGWDKLLEGDILVGSYIMGVFSHYENGKYYLFSVAKNGFIKELDPARYNPLTIIRVYDRS